MPPSPLQTPIAASRSQPGWRQRVAQPWPAVLCLALATIAAHGWALGDGLFLDDHWHRHELQSRGWSWDDLLDSAVIEPARFVDCWWQTETVRWRYCRPLSIALMKVVHVATGGSVVAQHAVGIVLHFLTTLLVWRLAQWLTGSRPWALVAGLLFVVYSHSVFAVAWLASQNVVLQTGLMLAALMAYLRASRLALRPDEPRPASPPMPRRGLLLASVGLWGLSLLARESAIVLPALLIAADLAFGGLRHLWARRWAHVMFACVGAMYLYWRIGLVYEPLPELYARNPVEAGPAWLAAKLLHYLTSAVWLSPMTIGPTGRLNPWTETPGDCIAMIVIVGVMSIGYWQATRRARGWWLWPAWILLSVLPVVPIMATPHTGYMCGVGFAIAMVLGAGLGRAAPAHGAGRWRGGVATWFLIATCIYIPPYRILWQAFLSAESATIDSLVRDERPPDDAAVYFINLPFVNVYAGMSLAERGWAACAGDPPQRYRVLTFAPNLLSMDQPCAVEQTDAQSFRVSILRERGGESAAATASPYFGGLLGRFYVEGMRGGRALAARQASADGEFTVQIEEADATGVWKISFRFRQPLANERYRFYLCTPNCPGGRVRFSPPGAPLRRWPEIEAALADSGAGADSRIAADCWRRDLLLTIRSYAMRLIRSDLYMTGPAFPGPKSVVLTQ